MTASFDQWTHFEVGTWFRELISYWEVMRCQLDLSITVCFYEILARTYAPGATAPGAWIIWGNILSSTCSKSIIWMYTAPGAYLCMFLEHCAF